MDGDCCKPEQFLIPECDIFTFELTHSLDLEHSEVEEEGHFRRAFYLEWILKTSILKYILGHCWVFRFWNKNVWTESGK